MRRCAKYSLRRAAVSVVAGMSLASMISVTHAASVSWNNSIGGNWSGPNWTGGVGTNPPQPADSARFNIANTYTVTLDVNPTVTQTIVAGSTVSFANSTAGRTYSNSSTMSVNSGTFNLTATTPIAWTSSNTTNFNSTVNVTNGNDFSALILGIGATSNSTTTISGAGTTLTVPGSTLIGNGVGTTGTLIFSNGASGSLNGGVDMALLNAGSTANLTVQTGASLTSNELKVASAPIATTATLIVTGAGTSLLQGGTGPLQVGASSLSQGNATFDSTATATLNFGMTVNATGVVTIQGGATVNTTSPVELNSGTGNGADLFIDGANSALTQSGAFGTVVVGGSSGTTAKIQLTNAGTYTTGTGASTVNATGLINIINGTFNANGNMTVNGGTVQRASTGTFNLAAGKTMTIQSIGQFNVTGSHTMSTTGAISITDPGSAMQVTGTLTIGGGGQISIASSGSLTANEERLGSSTGGSVTQSGGTHTVSGGTNPLRIAPTVGSTGSYTLSGGTLNVVNNFAGANGEAVGFEGTATFNQTGGVHTVLGTNGNLVIGYAPTGVGTYTISNSNLTAHSLYLGRDGGATGTLNVNSGAIVDIDTEFLDLGLNVGATGTVNANAGFLSAKGIFVGGVSTQARGAGGLNIAGGTVISSVLMSLANSGQVRVWDTAGSAINLSAGTLTCDTLLTSGNPSRFNWTGGGLYITGSAGFDISSSGPLGANLSLAAAQSLNVTNVTTIASGASLTITGGSHSTGGLSGAGTLTSSGALTIGAGNISATFTGNISGTGAFLKLGTGAQTLKHIRGGALTIDAGKIVIATNGTSTGTSKITSIGFPAASHSLDLTDNDLIVTGMTYGNVETLVKSGFGNFNWLGTGITSSTAATYAGIDGSRALGVINNADWGHATFGGQTVSGTDILVKFTWVADANVDGLVDNDDFGQFLYGFSGAGPARWLNGDFDYDNDVDNDDFGWFLVGLGAFQASGNMQLSEEFKSQLAEFASANGLPLVLPEPLSLGFVGACGFLLRRRHK